jgi:site-specific recombinase XerD
VPTPQEHIAEDFQRYLSQERGLTRVTVIHHLPVIRRFLRETCAGGAHCRSRLTRADVTGFFERHARDRGPDTAKGMCWTLRAFLRRQYRGQIAIDLAISVPSVRRWRFGSLPTYLSPAQVQKVLDACDRRTAMPGAAGWREELSERFAAPAGTANATPTGVPAGTPNQQLIA